MLFIAVVYDKNNEAFWRYSRKKSCFEDAWQAGKDIAKRFKVKEFYIIINRVD